MKRKFLLIVLLMVTFVSHAPTIAQNNDDIRYISVLSWSANSQYLAIGYSQGDIDIHDLNSGEIISSFQLDSSISHIAWHPNNDLIAVGDSRGNVVIFSIVSAEIVKTLPVTNLSDVSVMLWSPSGVQLFTAHFSSTDEIPALTIWDVVQEKYIGTYNTPTIYDMSWNSAYNTIAIANTFPGIEIINGETFEYLTTIGEEYETVIQDFRNSGAPIVNRISRLEWNSSQDLILSGSGDGIITIWSLDSGEIITQHNLQDRNSPILDVWFSPSEDYFASLDSSIIGSTYLTIWSNNDYTRILEIDLNIVVLVSDISPDKTKLAYVDENNELHIVTINDLITNQIRRKIDECAPSEALATTLNAYLDNSDNLGFVGELATLDENVLSADCVEQLTAMANLLTEDETD